MMQIFIVWSLFLSAQVPIPSETIQLQQLVTKAQKQLEALEKILEQSKDDTKSLQQASQILNRMSAGIEKSLKDFEGTDEYEKALVEVQAKENFSRTFSDAQRVQSQTPKSRYQNGEQDAIDRAFEDLKSFQSESVKANQEDLSHQEKLQRALIQAEPGFVPKIGAQAELGNWQASTRVSVQMTELIAAIHAMREELRSLRMNQNQSGLGVLISGAEQMNEKQREALEK